MENYPFTKCISPRRITNPYTKEKIVVGCGECYVCKMQKQNRMALKCRLESMAHRYTLFVTLTYSNEHIPQFTLIPDENKEGYYMIGCTRHNSGVILGHTDLSKDKIKMYQDKVVSHNGYFPCVDKKDVQLFLKRLRRKVNERIRYYVVAEYGPVHFRAHYHLLLWFSDGQTLSRLQQDMHKLWPFGRVDSQISFGDASAYVAKYLNSSCKLPALYSAGQVKPFSAHSYFLGEKFLKDSKEEVYALQPGEFVKRSFSGHGFDSEFFVWRSLKHYYYPKCKDYSTRSPLERLQIYTAYAKARNWTGEATPMSQAVRLCDIGLHLRESPYDSNRYPEWVVKLCSLCYPSAKTYLSEEYEETYLRSLYMVLRTSRHFISFCCDDDFNKFLPMVEKIDNFYKTLDYEQLKNQMSDQEDAIESDALTIEELVYFYDNVPYEFDRFKYSKPYREFIEKQLPKFNNSFKHKTLNDMNKIFTYG